MRVAVGRGGWASVGKEGWVPFGGKKAGGGRLWERSLVHPVGDEGYGVAGVPSGESRAGGLEGPGGSARPACYALGHRWQTST